MTPSDMGSVSAMGGCPLINAKCSQEPPSADLHVDHFDTTSFVNHYAAANEALGKEGIYIEELGKYSKTPQQRTCLYGNSINKTFNIC